MEKIKRLLLCLVISTVFIPRCTFASDVPNVPNLRDVPSVLSVQDQRDTEAQHHISYDFLLFIVVILIAAKISGLVEKLKQPAVLGELLAGVVLGNLALIGIGWFEPMKSDQIIRVLSELGVIILLFQIGLESNIAQMQKVGLRAMLVALVGVVIPFILGTFVVAPIILPESIFNTRLFIGAVLTATSVGITARVFKDLNKLNTREAQIVLGAAVIDDVLGLVILAVVSAIVTTGSVTPIQIIFILGKSVMFLLGSLLLGRYAAIYISKLFSRIHRGTGMKFTITLVFGLTFAYIASLIGLAPIIGAFAAGLVLDQVYFDDYEGADSINELKRLATTSVGNVKNDLKEIISHHEHRHIEYIIAPLGYLFVPVFFVTTGLGVDLRSFLNSDVLILAFGITVAAFVGKFISGLVAGNVNKLVVGVGMIPRGEVGLIFAVSGKILGVVDDRLYSAIVVMVIFSTLITPPLLSRLLKRM